MTPSPLPAIDEALTNAVRKRSTEFATQVRSLATTSTAVPTLQWTAADLAQHVAGLPQFWLGQHQSGPNFALPPDFAAFSDDARSHLVETGPHALADLIEREFELLTAHLTESDGQWLYGVHVAPSKLFGLAINELILHGRDLAAISGATPPTYESFEALAAADALMSTAGSFVDKEKARAQPDGIYHVRFRGGKDYTWTKKDDTLRITEGKPAKADAHLVTDPATFLLSSLGRISQLRAGLSGKMLSYGRKPWRFLGLANITVDGV